MGITGPEFDTIEYTQSKRQRATINQRQYDNINIQFIQTTKKHHPGTTTANTKSHSLSRNPNPLSNLSSPTTAKSITIDIKLVRNTLPKDIKQSRHIQATFFATILSKSKYLDRKNGHTITSTPTLLRSHIKALLHTYHTKSGQFELSYLPINLRSLYRLSNVTDSDIDYFLAHFNSDILDAKPSASSQNQSYEDTSEAEQDYFQNDDEYSSDNLFNEDRNESEDDIEMIVDQEVHHVSEDDSNITQDPEHEDIELHNLLNDLNHAQDSFAFNHLDFALVELFQLLRDSGAPLYMFDKLTAWAKRSALTFQSTSEEDIPSRKKFLSTLGNRLYGKMCHSKLTPKTKRINLTFGTSINVTTFGFKPQLATLLSDKVLMQQSNLLINLDQPFSRPEETDILDDINTGWWFRETHLERCTQPTDILVPIIIFIDSGKVTKRLSVEPIIFTLGIFNRSTRNLVQSWRTLGYIPNLSFSSRNKLSTYKTSRKMEDYHLIINHIFEDLKPFLEDNIGLPYTFEHKGKNVQCNLKFAMQVVLGDCEGHTKLCFFKGGHNLTSVRLCRDCDVSPSHSDDPMHKCTFLSYNEDIAHLSPKEMAEMGMQPLPPSKNAFSKFYFGARRSCILQCTPPEPLHGNLLGTLKYLIEEFLKLCPKRTIRLMDAAIQHYYRGNSRQSSHGFPSMAPFLNGIENPDMLGAKEQYARLFAIYIALLDTEVVASLLSLKKQIRDPEDFSRNIQLDPMKLPQLIKWFKLIEDSLTLYQWLMSPSHNKSDVLTENWINENDDIVSECKAQVRMRHYMKDYHSLMKNRPGNGLKIVKFHQHLHYVRQILKDGSIQNIDTGRPESIAVSMYKSIAHWTQRRGNVLNSQIAQNHFECSMVEAIIRTYPHNISNDICKIVLDGYEDNDIDVDVDGKFKPILCGSEFHLQLEDNNPSECITNKRIQVNWVGKGIVDVSHHSRVFEGLAKRLYFNTLDGDCLTHNSKVIGKSEYKHRNGLIFRAHPDFNSEGKWYDWCRIKWNDPSTHNNLADDGIPARIIMFIDISESKIMTTDEVVNLRETLSAQLGTGFVQSRRDVSELQSFLHEKKFAVIRSAISSDDSTLIDEELTDTAKLNRLIPSLGTRIRLEDQCRLVPLSSIESCCHAVPVDRSIVYEDAKDFFVMKDIEQWRSTFLYNDNKEFVVKFDKNNNQKKKLKSR